MSDHPGTPAEGIALTEREALELIAFLVSSAETCLHEPAYYGSFRLMEAASMLMARMRRGETPLTGDFFAAFQAEIDAKQGWMMWDREGYFAFLREAPARVAAELKRLGAGEETR